MEVSDGFYFLGCLCLHFFGSGNLMFSLIFLSASPIGNFVSRHRFDSFEQGLKDYDIVNPQILWFLFLKEFYFISSSSLLVIFLNIYCTSRKQNYDPKKYQNATDRIDDRIVDS